MRIPRLVTFAGVVLAAVVAVSPVVGYIHFPPPTLLKLCEQSRAIRLLTVKKHDKEKGVILFEATETLKGKTPDGKTFKHVIGREDNGTKPIYDWVADGKQAVMFTLEAASTDIACGYVFIDKYCYSIDRNGTGEFWLLIRVDPELAGTFHGSAEKLREVTKDILAGKAVTVPVDNSIKGVSIEERKRRAPALNEIMVKNREK